MSVVGHRPPLPQRCGPCPAVSGARLGAREPYVIMGLVAIVGLGPPTRSHDHGGWGTLGRRETGKRMIV